MEQQPQRNLLVRFILFLRNRDARIIELFFWALNVYMLILIIALSYSDTTVTRFIIRIIFQITTTTVNTFALVTQAKGVRIASAIANTAAMTLITVSLASQSNANAGTYGLLGLLAVFVCWKINIR
jgi:hypothetical protein